MAASVVDLPLPVIPVTSTRPRSSRAMVRTTSGSPNDSMVGTLNGISRSTIEKVPRWRQMFTRKRDTPGRE